MDHSVLIHDAHDHVGVAIRDLARGERVTARCLTGGDPVALTVREDIPLGHKVALTALAPGGVVRKYDAVIGTATQAIQPGDHVHVHNLRSVRWG